ncbi:MAG: hypothetical protein FWG10_12780 [Eubacteriaceae bacterium]|nr:hypothetical protein [Eubacteriaceae bacterium]
MTQEQVFEAIAFTYGDPVLAKAIDAQKTQAPNGFVIEGFHAEDYSAYTNDDYAGMYLDGSGQLVICYRRGSKSAEAMRANNEKSSSRLSARSGKTLVDSVAISEVEHSYTELLAAYGYLNKTAAGYKNIKEFWVDEENNKIVVGIFDDGKARQTKEELLSALGESMLSFVKSDPEDKVKEIDSINGTSSINNNNTVTTAGGQMWSSSKGCNGVITCAHGYSNNDVIRKGNQINGTIIGQIKDLKYVYSYGNWNDSSFIKLNSPHIYTGVKYDEISSQTPVVNSSITLRGYKSISKSATVKSTNASYIEDGINWGNLIKVDKPMQKGDSGGGAIGGTASHTNYIVGINKSTTIYETWLVKGSVILNAFK